MTRWQQYAAALAAAAVLGLCLRGGVVQGMGVPTGAMEGTLLVGDYVLVNRLVYGAPLRLWGRDWGRLPGVRRPLPGDVVVFRLPSDPARMQMGRCVAVGGQRVRIADKQVWVDGARVADPPEVLYSDGRVLAAEISTRDNLGPLTVPDGTLFVLGDNRDNSMDSRVFRAVPLRLVEGRATMIWWSWAAREEAYGDKSTSRPGGLGADLWQMPRRLRWERLGRVVF